MLTESWNTFSNWFSQFFSGKQPRVYPLMQSAGDAYPSFLFQPLKELSVHSGDQRVSSKAYLDRMAEVFRYLNQPAEAPLVPLRTELAFVESYTYLIATRQPGKLQVRMEVSEAMLSQMLPPRSIQKVIEMAMKQNVMTADHPLLIQIQTTADGRLQISNNRQQKNGNPPVQVDVLAEINGQYARLNGRRAAIQKTSTLVRITLPLFPESESGFGQEATSAA